MSRFARALQDISGRLSLPQQVRSRVLVEIAGDLDDLFEAYCGRGYREADAEREALSRMDLSDEALLGLARVHGGWFRRLTDGVAQRAGNRWEKVMVGLLVAVGVGVSGVVIQAVPMSRAAGFWLIPVVGAALAAAGLGLWKAYVIWLRGDHRPQGLNAGLEAMLAMSVLEVFLAFGGVGFTGYQALGALRAAPERAAGLTTDWLLASLALLVMSLRLAMVGGLAWFFLVEHVASIERRGAADLLRH